MAFDRHAFSFWIVAMYPLAYSPAQIAEHDAFLASLTPAQQADLLDMLAVPLPPASVLLDIYTANFRTDFCPPRPSEQSPTEIVSRPFTPSSPPPSTASHGFTTSVAVAPSVGVAEEKSKSMRCGDYIYGRRHYCCKRLCPDCSRVRHWYMRNNLVSHVRQRPHQSIHSLTLTVPASSSPLRSAVADLVASMKQLRRRRRAWDTVVGGVWFLDITYNAIAQHWHPHLHLIIEADAPDIEAIAYRWLQLSGGGVHVSPLQDAPEDAQRLADYHTLPPHLKDASNIADAARRDEYARAVKGRQLFRPFGTWSSLRLLARDR